MNSRDRLLLAVSVLSAVAYGCRCDDGDITELRRLAECEEERQMPLDDLACTIVWREIHAWRSLNSNPRAL
jgi:hypothetical protein